MQGIIIVIVGIDKGKNRLYFIKCISWINLDCCWIITIRDGHDEEINAGRSTQKKKYKQLLTTLMLLFL